MEPDSDLPLVVADLLLIHPPAFFDFRERRDIYFPYLCTSGDVPITPLYEYFPLGFKSLQGILSDQGHDVRIINLASVIFGGISSTHSFWRLLRGSAKWRQSAMRSALKSKGFLCGCWQPGLSRPAGNWRALVRWNALGV